MLLAQPVSWVHDPTAVLVCVGVSVLTFVLGPRLPGVMAGARPGTLLLWADALGLAIFAVTGTAKAFAVGAHPFTAVVLGTLTASFGGIIRDILAGDVPLVLHREIYVTAAFAGGAVFAGLPDGGPAAGRGRADRFHRGIYVARPGHRAGLVAAVLQAACGLSGRRQRGAMGRQACSTRRLALSKAKDMALKGLVVAPF